MFLNLAVIFDLSIHHFLVSNDSEVTAHFRDLSENSVDLVLVVELLGGFVLGMMQIGTQSVNDMVLFLGQDLVTIEVEGHQEICQSVSTEDDLSLSYCGGFDEVFLGKGLVFLDGGVDNVLGDQESFVGPLNYIEVVGIFIGDVVLVDKCFNIVVDGLPGAFVEWKLCVSGKLVDDRVPHSMEITSPINIWKIDQVSSEVAPLIRFVYSCGGMKWLMNVTSVVDEEPHGVGESVSLRVIMMGVFHDSLILVCLLVTVCLVHPHVKGLDHFGDVVGVTGEVEVRDFASLVKVGLIDEMPSFLPITTFAFDFIGECRAFNHWMVILRSSPLWIINL